MIKAILGASSDCPAQTGYGMSTASKSIVSLHLMEPIVSTTIYPNSLMYSALPPPEENQNIRQ